jgi:hypothetical protein
MLYRFVSSLSANDASVAPHPFFRVPVFPASMSGDVAGVVEEGCPHPTKTSGYETKIGHLCFPPLRRYGR